MVRTIEAKINLIMIKTRSCEEYIEDCRIADLHYYKGLLQADVIDAKHRYESLKAELDKMNQRLGVANEVPEEPKNKKQKGQGNPID